MGVADIALFWRSEKSSRLSDWCETQKGELFQREEGMPYSVGR